MNKIFFEVNDGVITINGKIFDLLYPVVEALQIGGLVVVRVEPNIGEILNTNVYAISASGDCKWEIEESYHGTEEDKPFTSISISPDNKLIAGNWNGVDYIVDLNCGKISTFSFNK